MTRCVAVLPGLTLVALVGATLWVPMHLRYTIQPRGYVPPQAQWEYVEMRSVWNGGVFKLEDGGPGVTQQWAEYSWEPIWHLLLAEQAIILLLGGGLLTWVVRRERRRQAEADDAVTG